MWASRLLVLTVAVALLTSCEKDNTPLVYDRSEVAGTYRLATITIDGVDARDLEPGWEPATWMLLSDSAFFSRNYVNGEWVFAGDSLHLMPRADANILDVSYAIVERGPYKLVLQTSQMPGIHFPYLGSLRPDVKYTTRETYTREP